MSEQPGSRGKKHSLLPKGVFEKFPGSKDYWIRYTIDGKIRREHIGRSLSAARELVEQRRADARRGKIDPDSIGRARKRKMTVKEMFEHYLPLRVTVKNKGEDERYAQVWSGQFGELALDDVTPADLDEWKAKRLRQVKPATVNRALEYLKAYYNLALRDEHCKSNPVSRVQLLTENNERHRYLSELEETKLRQRMSPEDFDLVLFALHSGLRQGEQFPLRWSQVDLAAKTLKVLESKHGLHRFVQLNKTCIDVLGRQKDRIQARGQSEWVFPGTRRLDVSRDAHNFCRTIFQPALALAKIKNLVWHDLRHTFGSRLVQRGVPLYTVGKLMGHSSAEMTRRYAHLAPGHLQEAVEQLLE